MSERTKRERTPGEEAFFKRNPKLAKSMENLRSNPGWEEMDRHLLEAELQFERLCRTIDDLKRSLY